MLTAEVYTIPPLVTRCSIVKAERRFLRTATDTSTVYERATTTVSVWARKIAGTARNAIINPCDQVHTKVNVSMTNESAGSETSSTTTSATTTTINANIQQPKTVLLQTARAVALKERQNFDSSQDSVWYRKSKNLCHWKIYDRSWNQFNTKG